LKLDLIVPQLSRNPNISGLLHSYVVFIFSLTFHSLQNILLISILSGLYFFYLYYSDSLISNQAATVVLVVVGIPGTRKQFNSKMMSTYYSRKYDAIGLILP